MSGSRTQISRYEPRWRTAWDDFVRGSRNGHFMLERGYLDYHAERFDDMSVIFLRNGRPEALLPAHRRGDELISHAGLPFGGLTVAPEAKHAKVRAIFEALFGWLRENGIRRLVYTPAPVCYHVSPFEDDLYLLHRAGGRCSSMKLSAGFAGPAPGLLTAETRHSLRKAKRKLPCEFFESDDVPLFWDHLERALQKYRAARPLHTAQEMTLLKSRFPEQIRLFFARAGGEIVGGNLIYLTPRVQRGQYGFRHLSDPSSVSRRLHLWLAAHPEHTRPWIDFGTSMAPSTGEVDETLLFSKEQSGARGTIVQTWTCDIA